MSRKSIYNNVDELPDLTQKLNDTEQPKYKTVDELPDVKKKEDTGFFGKLFQKSGESSSTSNTTNSNADGFQKIEPIDLNKNRSDNSIGAQQSQIKNQIANDNVSYLQNDRPKEIAKKAQELKELPVTKGDFNGIDFIKQDIINNGGGEGLKNMPTSLESINKYFDNDANNAADYFKRRNIDIDNQIGDLYKKLQYLSQKRVSESPIEDNKVQKPLIDQRTGKYFDYNNDEEKNTQNQISELKDYKQKLQIAQDNIAKKYAAWLSPNGSLTERGKIYNRISGDSRYDELKRLEDKGIPISQEDKYNTDIKGLEVAKQQLEDEYEGREKDDNYYEKQAELNSLKKGVLNKYPEFKKQQGANLIAQLASKDPTVKMMALTGSGNLDSHLTDYLSKTYGVNPKDLKGLTYGDIPNETALGNIAKGVTNAATSALAGGIRIGGTLLGADEDYITDVNKQLEGVGNNIFGDNPYEHLQEPNTLINKDLETISNPRAGKYNYNSETIKNAISSGVGNLLGFIGGTKGAGKLLSLGDDAAMTSYIIGSGYEPNYQKANEVMGKDAPEVNKGLYAAGMGYLEALAFKFLPKDKIFFGSAETKAAENELAKTLAGMDIKSINRDLLESKMTKVIKAAAGTVEETAKIGGAMSAAEIAKAAVNTLLGSDKDEAQHIQEGISKVGGVLRDLPFSMAIPLGLMEIPKGIQHSNRFKETLFDAGNNPDSHEAAIRQAEEKGIITTDEANKKMEVVNTMKNIVKSTPTENPTTGEPLTHKQQVEYAYNRVKEIATLAKKDKINGDLALAQHYDKQAREMVDERKSILDGTQDEYKATSDLYDRIKQKTTQHNVALNQGTKTEGVQYLQEQALQAPYSIKKSLKGDEDLTTDLIARNSPEEIKAQIKDLKEKQKKADENEHKAESNEYQRHIDLLEAGLEKTKKQTEDTKLSQSIEGLDEQGVPIQEPSTVSSEGEQPSTVSGKEVGRGGDVRKGDKQFKRAFGELNEAKTAEEKLNAINTIRRNEKVGGVLTDAEKQQIDDVEKGLKEEGYEMPNLYGVKYHEGMRLEVVNAKSDDTLADGEVVITKVLSPQINKDGKMIQAAKVETTVGTKEGGLSRNEWLAEQKNKSLPTQEGAEQPTVLGKGVGSGVGGDVEFKNEGKADTPTQKNVQERTGINHPFMQKVSEGLRRLGILKNGESAGAGYVQGIEGGGFTSRLTPLKDGKFLDGEAGSIIFKDDGSISVSTEKGSINFDKNGNIISHDIKEKIRTKQDIQNDIDSKTKSKQDFEKIRDSEDFKYKDSFEYDPNNPLSKGRKVKIPKTDTELKESTDKINKVIDKLNGEINDHKKELETAPEQSLPTQEVKAEQPTVLGKEEGSVGGDVESPKEFAFSNHQRGSIPYKEEEVLSSLKSDKRTEDINGLGYLELNDLLNDLDKKMPKDIVGNHLFDKINAVIVNEKGKAVIKLIDKDTGKISDKTFYTFSSIEDAASKLFKVKENHRKLQLETLADLESRGKETELTKYGDPVVVKKALEELNISVPKSIEDKIKSQSQPTQEAKPTVLGKGVGSGVGGDVDLSKAKLNYHVSKSPQGVQGEVKFGNGLHGKGFYTASDKSKVPFSGDSEQFLILSKKPFEESWRNNYRDKGVNDDMRTETLLSQGYDTIKTGDYEVAIGNPKQVIKIEKGTTYNDILTKATEYFGNEKEAADYLKSKGVEQSLPTQEVKAEQPTVLGKGVGSGVSGDVEIKYGGKDKDLKGNPQKQWMKPTETSEQATNRLAEFVEASDFKGREQSAFIDKDGENTEVKLRNDNGKWNWYYPKSKKPFASFDTAKDAIKFIQEQPFWDNGELNKNGRDDAYFAKVKAEQIKRELENGNILEDIKDGKISVQNAKAIIENAGVKVPEEIQLIPTQEVKPTVLSKEVNDAEYNEFIDKGKVSKERLNDISNKVKNRELLSDREKEIFTDKTSEINKIIAEQPTVLENKPTNEKEMPKEVSDLYIKRSQLEFTKNALKMQMGKTGLRGKAKIEYDNVVSELNSVEHRINEYENRKSTIDEQAKGTENQPVDKKSTIVSTIAKVDSDYGNYLLNEIDKRHKEKYNGEDIKTGLAKQFNETMADRGEQRAISNLEDTYMNYVPIEVRAEAYQALRKNFIKQSSYAKKETKAQEPTQEVNDGGNKGNEPIPTEKVSNTKTANGEDIQPLTENNGNEVGVSHENLTDLAKRIGLNEPERGEWHSPDWYAERGRQLLEAGADPKEVDNTNNELHDRISIARAHLENLVKAADKLAKKFGVDSDPYEMATKEINDYANGVVKKLGNLAGQAMTSLQGKRDLDTDSFTAVKKATEEYTSKILNKDQEKKIKELTDKNNELKKRADEAEAKLIAATDEAFKRGVEEGSKKTKSEKAKKIADKLRENAKLHKPGSFSAATPASAVWDAAIEIVAKGIEAGGKIADVINDGLDYIKNTDWYKGLTPDKQSTAERDFKQFANDKTGSATLEDLQERFIDKKDNKFSLDEGRDIWEYAKKTYLDNGVSYKEMIPKLMDDLGLTWRQISEAITLPKTKRQSDEMWNKQADYRRNQNATKSWVESQNKSWVGKLLNKISGAFRGVSVFGHGGIFVGTHAGMTLFQPRTWKYVIPAFLNGYRFAYGKRGNYERAMEGLKNSPNYVKAQRAGLKNNPDRINAEEYQKSQHFINYILPKSLHHIGEKITTAGERGFNAIKVLRQGLFDYHYNKLSEEAKNDPASLESIARLVNNATGATNLNIPKWVNEVTFAGGMEASRWGKLTRNPVEASATALKALITPDKVPIADRVFAKVWASRVGEQLATMTSIMLANAATQALTNPKNPVNLTNPDKPDFLKLKFGNITVDPTSGMRGVAMFIYGLGKIPFMSKKDRGNDDIVKYTGKQALSYGRGKLAPLYSTLADFFFHQDYNKNEMPYSDEKPAIGRRKLTWGEYAWEKAPLPIAEAAQVTYQSAIDNGADKVTLNHLLNGIVSGMLSGGTGFRVSEYDSEHAKHSPFTDEDKNSPIFKYYLDKGIDLPNTSLSSEIVTNEKNRTKKAISEYPKDVQEKYNETHKEYLKKELSDIKDKGYVYVKEYTNTKGDKKIEVYTEKKDRSIKKSIDELTKDELEQVLHIAQSKATQKAKKVIFK